MVRSRSVAALSGVLLLGAAGTTSSPLPQAPPQQQPATPTLPVVRTELVQLDVTVADKDGRNVSGLTARDFVLLEDGRAQALSHFADRRPSGGGIVGAVSAPRRLQRRRPPPSLPAPASSRRAARPAPGATGGRPAHGAFEPAAGPGCDAAFRARADLERRPCRRRYHQRQRRCVPGLHRRWEALVRAIARLRSRYEPVEALGRPYLTEHQAELIDRGDVEALRVATEELLQIDDYMGEEFAKTQAYNQARRMVVEMTQRSGRALAVIESVVRGLSPLTGRKVVVLASDGFLIGLGLARDERLRRAHDHRRRHALGHRALRARHARPRRRDRREATPRSGAPGCSARPARGQTCRRAASRRCARA